MNSARVLVCLVAAPLACLQVSAAHAYVLTGSSWPAPETTFSVDIPGVNGLWNTTFEEAMTQWSSDTVFAYSVKHQFGDPCSNPNTNLAVNGVAFSSTFCGSAWGSGVVAVTGSWSSGGVLKQAGITFNSNYPWNVYTGPLQSDLDFRRVAVHEVGHALGLGHENVQPSIMNPNVGNTENPTADDIAGVHALYDSFVPLPFAFVDQANVAPSATIISAAVTITGITAPTVISVTGGTYSINCTATFTSTALTIRNNRTVCVRHTSAATASTATNTVLRVGGITDTFTSTTLADTTPDAFSFGDQANVALSTPITSAAVTITGITAATPISVTGGSYSIGCDETFTNAAGGIISNNQTVCVRHTSAATSSTATNTVLTVGGVADTFTSTTVAAVDTDGDGIEDVADNCIYVANASQCDSDGDGYGNQCDGDLNNNGFTNAQDTTLFRQQLGQPSVSPTYNKADLNCNGYVNAQDTTLFRQLLGAPPGPSGLCNATFPCAVDP